MAGERDQEDALGQPSGAHIPPASTGQAPLCEDALMSDEGPALF